MIKHLTKLPLLKRLLPSIIRRICNLLNINFFVVRYEQIYLKLKITDAVDRHILFRGEYENAQIEYLLESIKKNQIDYFIDIGSNIGLYSLLVEKNFPKIKIFSFEPHPEAFKRFEYNLKMNKSKNISVHNIALSNENKKSFLSTGDNNVKNFKNFQSGGAQVDVSGDMPIILSKGDDILTNQNDVLGIKIDVEGHENLVLNGINTLLIENKVFIQIEIHNEKFAKVNQILTTFGYKQLKKIGFHDYYYSNF